MWILGTFPLWILLLGREFIDTHNVHFPYVVNRFLIIWINWIISDGKICLWHYLVWLFQLVNRLERREKNVVCLISGFGLLLRWLKPRIADRFTRWLRFITLFFIVYILTFGIYTNLYVFQLINYRTVIVSAILPYGGFLIGFLMSLITRQSRERSIAIFIESGMWIVHLNFRKMFCYRFTKHRRGDLLSSPIVASTWQWLGYYCSNLCKSHEILKYLFEFWYLGCHCNSNSAFNYL
jgi:hypothetical protein